MKIVVVNPLEHILLHLVILHSDNYSDNDSDSNIDRDSEKFGLGYCSASSRTSTTCSTAACDST